MSHRAIRRLRQEENPIFRASEGDGSDDEDDDEEEDEKPKKLGFAMMMMDDDASSSSESSASDKDEEEASLKQTRESNQAPPAAAAKESDPSSIPSASPEKTTEDLDQLLEEFKLQDDDVLDDQEDNVDDGTKHPSNVYYDVLTHGMDSRDLDIDHVMKTSLLGSYDSDASRSRTTQNRRGRNASVFGPSRDNWPKPPHYVGGGMGMSTYANNESSSSAASQKIPTVLPWPYSDMKEGDDRCPVLEKWFCFTLSDSYQRDVRDLQQVKATGDPNALAMFIAHHPFVVEALLQLSGVLYQTNHSQEGLSLLKRALYVLEHASLNSFLAADGRLGFLDKDQECNELFFLALVRLIRVARVAGLSRACLAASRFLLSLDPLRDPMATLLSLDYFALQTHATTNDRWIVDFVDSKRVQIFYRDDSGSDELQCDLLQLPNWAFSYALALYRLWQEDSSSVTKEKARSAMQLAVKRFPSAVEELLVKNEVKTTGRSFQVDWPTVLPFLRERAALVSNTHSAKASQDPVVRACVSQVIGKLIGIFVQQNFKLWALDAVWKHVYEATDELRKSTEVVPEPYSPALMRFTSCNPSEFDDKVETFPADANPLDPTVIAHALTVDVNRPRFLQRANRGGPGFGGDDHMLQGHPGGALAGPPTEMIDPDWPLAEVFWRSALPWAHVEGVPPPPR